jgi:hypothetical protein
MIRRVTLAAALALCLPAAAGEFDTIGSLSQGEFHRLSQDLGAAFSYKGVTPATPLGLLGFDVGVEATRTTIENSSLFRRAGGSEHSELLIPKLHVYKGLPAGFDIGAFLAGSSDVGATLVGVDLRYAVLDDSLAMPAVALRLSGTRATGLGKLNVGTLALDVMVSKKFALLTPYAGAGTVRVQSRPHADGLGDENFNVGRVFGGVNLNLLAVNLAFEAEKTGKNTSLTAKVGWRF